MVLPAVLSILESPMIDTGQLVMQYLMKCWTQKCRGIELVKVGVRWDARFWTFLTCVLSVDEHLSNWMRLHTFRNNSMNYNGKHGSQSQHNQWLREQSEDQTSWYETVHSMIKLPILELKIHRLLAL